jgi:threonylcarbamoyladenosine tRNA methylthiotransferase MtaB
MPHFHIPLQSGNDKQLRDMRRRYRRDLYAERVATIKNLMPHACIGCDVIVGFPGETEADFLETYQFIQNLDVSYLHVFTYSERANTPAAEMPGVVSVEERRRRNQALRGLVGNETPGILPATPRYNPSSVVRTSPGCFPIERIYRQLCQN